MNTEEAEAERPRDPSGKRGPSLSTQVLIGLLLGIATGLFFGERATAVDIVGQAFVRLLQMSVIPYVVVSLIAGIGQLDARTARDLALRGGGAVVLLWVIAWAGVSLFPVAFPEYETASFFSTTLVTTPPPVDMLALYIPANPFDALVNGIMPAIVLFSISLGIALMAVPNREGLVGQLTVLSDSLMKLNTFVVGLAPIGVFALMASAAGTITLEELARLQVFIVTFAAMALLLALWVLPGFVAAVTPLRYRDVVGTSRDALITAFATGSLLIVLPILAAQARRLSMRDPGADRDDVSPAEVMVSVAFNFPSAGKLLGLSFILFAGWFSGSDLSLTDLPTLLSVGTFTFFGPNAMAMPFMLDFFKLPSDLFQIFLAVDVVTGRFTTLLAAMHVLCVALFTGVAMEKRLQVGLIPLLRWGLLSVALSVLVLVGARLYFAETLDTESKTYQMFINMELSGEPVRVLSEAPKPTSGSRGNTLTDIRSSGVLQACYAADALPFAFVNGNSRLVGYDIDVMHSLAREMGVDLYFRRIERADFGNELHADCHILIGGIAMTPRRVEQMRFTHPYLDNTLSFIVRDHDRHAFSTWDEIRARERLRIAIPNVPHYVTLMKQKLPNAEFVEIHSVRDFFREQIDGADAMVFGAESAGAWTLVYPSFSVVVPKPRPIGIPIAYGIRRDAAEWGEYLNVWVDLKTRDGTLDEYFEHWILGRAADRKAPRWSVIRDVLGWVD